MAYHLSKSRKKKKFRLARTKDMTLLVMLAEQKGFFHDHGINIEYVDVPYARRGMELLIAGEVDIATMVETNFAYLGYYKPKTPFKGFASIEKRTSDHFLMRGANKNPTELIGKTVGFMPRTTSHTFLIHFLRKHSIDKKDIKLKVISPQAMPNAIIRGEVDAISLWQPYVNNTMLSMDELGIPYTHFKNYGEHISEVAVVASKNLLIRNRKLVEGILLGLKDAENFYKSNTDLTYQILANTMRISGQWHKKVLGEYNAELSMINNNYLEKILDLSNWIRTNDTEFIGKEEPNYLDFIDNSFFFDIFPNNN